MTSLFARLLAGFVLVAVCSVTATAWLTARTTSGAIRREQGETLATDTRINDAVLGYAATHRDWSAVASFVDGLAAKTGRRIALTGDDGRVLADSAPGEELPERASARIDPLQVDATVTPHAAADRIDPRAAGPFTLGAADRARLTASVQRKAKCIDASGRTGKVTFGYGGHPIAVATGAPASARPNPDPARPGRPLPADETALRCETLQPDSPTASEKAALAALRELLDGCLERRAEGEPVRQPARLAFDPAKATGVLRGRVTSAGAECLGEARRAQLGPYVAPSALLFIDASREQPGIGLPALAGVTFGVLAIAIAVSTVIATGLARPVRALTGAVQRMRDGDASARVGVRASGEVGRLAGAFNEMAGHLERLERQRKDMVSDVSHELRTPLANLRGWLEAVQDGVARADPRLLSSLLDEVGLLQRLVDDLQQLALADAGKLRLHAEPVDVGELVRQAVTAHLGTAAEAGVALSASGGDGVVISADPVRLRQALGNLLSNAVRHTPRDGRIAVRARSSDRTVIIEVADTGPGIPPEDLPHVFDRFWRADKSRSRSTGGSGLGLAVVKHLAEAHAGTATVTSTPGQGTTVTLTLPLD